MLNNTAFRILLFSTIVSEIAFQLPLGALPLALLRDGATHSEVAFAMGGGLFAQLLGSVPIGALVDKIGRLRTVRGALVLVSFTTIGMTFAHGPLAAGLLMALRGFSGTAYITAEFAYVSEIIPKERSVSAVSILSTLANAVFAIAPAVAVFLWNHGIAREQFAYGGFIALAGGSVLWMLPRGAHDRASKRSRLILMRSKWLPAMAFLSAVSMQSGVNTALAVVTFTQRGIANGALIFTSMAFMAAALRYPSGLAVERFGARALIFPLIIVEIAGCLTAANAHTAGMVLLAGALLGTAWSAVVPVGIALYFAQSSPGTRGAAMGAYNLSFAIGTSAGALLAALLTRFGMTYAAAIYASALAPIAAAPFLFVRLRRERPRPAGISGHAGSPHRRADQALRK